MILGFYLENADQRPLTAALCLLLVFAGGEAENRDYGERGDNELFDVHKNSMSGRNRCA